MYFERYVFFYGINSFSRFKLDNGKLVGRGLMAFGVFYYIFLGLFSSFIFCAFVF